MANAAGNSGVVAGDGDLELLDEIVLGSARGGAKRAQPVMMEIVRSLTADDLPAIRNPKELGSVPTTAMTAQMRHSHHQIAQLITKGLEMAEVSLITGYSPSYLSALKHNPAFVELIEHYSVQRQALFVDVLERMNALGIASMEELQQRLADEPEKWTKRELMDLTELMFGSGGARPGGVVAQPSAGVNIEVKFISGRSPANGQGIIDVEPNGSNHR